MYFEMKPVYNRLFSLDIYDTILRIRITYTVFPQRNLENSMSDKKNNKTSFRDRFQPYVFFCIAAIVFIQLIVYYVTRLFLDHTALHDLMTPLDERIPFIPQWVIVYFLSFFSWAVNAVLIISDSKEHGFRFTSAYCFALIVSGAIFILYPGTLRRPEITGTGAFPELMRFLYSVDSATNLCPSLHVLASYFCWRGSADAENLPAWLAPVNFIFLILVCLSILFIKQHVLIDIPSAVILAEISLFVAKKMKLECIPGLVDAKLKK